MSKFYNSEVSSAEMPTGSIFSNVINQRNSQREAGTGTFNSGDYDVVGINTSMIPQMRQAIREYVDKINEYLNQVQANTDPSIALKGTGMEQAVKEYIQNVVKYCQVLCSNLLVFSDKLVKVEEAWRTSDQNMTNKVNFGSSELNSAAGQTYTEQFMG